MTALLLVPTALRGARAARRLCDAEGGLLFGLRVVTPDGLAALVLAAARDARPLLTPLAEELLAREAAGAPGGAAPGGAVERARARAVLELRGAELTAEATRRAAGEAGGRAADRLRELAAVLAAYEERLAALGALDRAAALRAASEALPRAARRGELRDLDLAVVDGFAAPGPALLDLLAGLVESARRSVVRAPFFPERPDASAPAEALVRRLERLHEAAARRDVRLALEGLDGERAPRLAAVLRAVAGAPGGPAPAGAAGEVLSRAGAGEEGEAEAAAELAARFLERGIAPDEVILLAPAPARAAPTLARACAARGVPFAAGRGAPLAEVAPVRAVRAAMEAAASPSRAALEGLAASPWLAPSPAPRRLAFLLDRAGAIEGRGDPEAALRRRAASLRSPGSSSERAELARAADALGALRAAVAPLASAGRGRDHASRLRGVLAHAGARRRAARGDPELARREVEALGRLEELADELARALALVGRGEEVLPARSWRELVDAALEGAAAPPSPEAAAGAVELWAHADAPGLLSRAAVVLGCARGAFPAAPAPEPLLGDAERLALGRAVRRPALPTSPARRAERLHQAFCALAAGREALGLTWAAAGPEGAGASPAPLAVEALLAAGAEVPAAPAGDPPLHGARTRAEALRAVARAAAAGAGSDAVEALARASPELALRAASALARGAVEGERRRALVARTASPVAGALPPELARELRAALPAEWTPSQLEAHARCPYRTFGRVVLRLGEEPAAGLDVDPRDEGSLAHAVLERFFRARVARGAPPLRGDPAERAELEAAAAEVFDLFAGDGRLGDPAVWAARRASVLERLARVVAAEAREADGLAPALLEYRFGGLSGVPPIEVGEGADRVLLQGRIDRVDAGPGRLLVVDYKDSRARSELRRKLEPEAMGTTNFQVPVYLRAAARALPGRDDARATYLLLRAAERLPPAGGGPEAEVDAAIVRAVREARAGSLPIAPRDCGGCHLGALCRAQGSEVEEAA